MAWVVGVDMGYGHQRTAYPFRDIAYEGIITANGGTMVDPAERRRWTALQRIYEGVSRVNNVPLIGPWLWRTYGRLQAISPHYPFRELSKPTFGSIRLDRLMRQRFGRSVVEYNVRISRCSRPSSPSRWPPIPWGGTTSSVSSPTPMVTASGRRGSRRRAASTTSHRLPSTASV